MSYKLLKKIDKSGFILKRDANIARHDAGFIISLCVDNACVTYTNPIIVLSIKIEIAIPYNRIEQLGVSVNQRTNLTVKIDKKPIDDKNEVYTITKIKRL